jgi:hypothetical protein
MRTRLATPAILAILALTLAGCTPSTPSPTASPSDSETPSASATPTESASPTADPVDPNILFTITVTATSPSGAIAHLRQAVYAPVASTSSQVADEAALDSECDGWRAAYPSPAYVVTTIEITDESPAGKNWTTPVAVVSMNGWPTFTGSVSSFMAYCASVQVSIGSSRGVTPVNAAAGADGAGGWAHILFGFGIATNAGSDVPGPTDTLLSDCQIVLSPAASASAIASTWSASTASPLNCSFGTA